MQSRAVTIHEYQDRWQSDFDLVAADLRAVLDSEALSIDHIGSTAVPGLCAKDVIDVQVTVRALGGSVSRKLLDAGFTIHKDLWRQDHVPPGFEANQPDWRKLFCMQRAGARRSNIHVREVGRPNQRYPLLVRDFLRNDTRTAEAYGRLKRRLAVSLADPETYPDVKDPVADLIYLAAERWAHQTEWRQALAGAE